MITCESRAMITLKCDMSQRQVDLTKMQIEIHRQNGMFQQYIRVSDTVTSSDTRLPAHHKRFVCLLVVATYTVHVRVEKSIHSKYVNKTKLYHRTKITSFTTKTSH